MNIAALLLILEMVQRTVRLAPEIAELIRKANAGEEVTPEEIARTEQAINNAVSDWDSACEKDDD